MKKRRIRVIFCMISLVLLISSVSILAEERDIYVGDLINIKVDTLLYDEDDLRDKFKDFEIVDIKDTEEGYILTLRSFETGKKTVKLDNKEIEIDIKSTLDEIDRDEPYEGELNTESHGFSFDYSYVFYLLLIIFLVAVSITIIKFIRKRKKISLSIYQRFKNDIDSISLEDHDCFVKMTLSLKNYLQSKYQCSIRGKTCDEIMLEISPITNLKDLLTDIKSWLKISDYYKFSGVVVTIEQKQELLNKLIALVEKIEQAKEVEV
ncbi:hypothetical protein SH1V18_48510 [Vallitalea longa]|uniref:Uncharacterized protein n=1 Tax=Vallitalea longa TaxID=2936439 RepID=A0A9W6DGJ6_9FIRM|nr:hypothetical protein [Vallitalea longa]GKX32371.1 hypothetical protein SH1V18_48510 [Vallitalea longa]